MEAFVSKLRRDFPSLRFVESPLASWSHQGKTVYFSTAHDQSDKWTTLHELGHALLGHSDFTSDADLLQKEVEAWDKAVKLGKKYRITVDPEHIQSCLDTYRDWLHKRSNCPNCGCHGLQQNKALYRCPGCQTMWKVGNNRFCRPYRLKKDLAA